MRLHVILLAMSSIALGIIPGVSEDAAGLLQGTIDAAGPGDTIQLKEGIYRQTVTIDRSVNIIGAGPGKTFIDGDKRGSVFSIGKTNPDIDVKLSGVTIRGGSSSDGGGINNSGRLTVEDSTITGNTAEFGGGISNFGAAAELRVNNVSIIGNSVVYDGAGIYNNLGVLIINSGTITENTAEVGAGVFNNHGTVVVNGGTIMKNTATKRCGGLLNNGAMDLRGGNIVDNTLGNVYTPA